MIILRIIQENKLAFSRFFCCKTNGTSVSCTHPSFFVEHCCNIRSQKMEKCGSLLMKVREIGWCQSVNISCKQSKAQLNLKRQSTNIGYKQSRHNWDWVSRPWSSQLLLPLISDRDIVGWWKLALPSSSTDELWHLYK